MEIQPWMLTMIDSLTLTWTPTHIFILIFMVAGIFINGGAIIFLFRKNSPSMFHKLLKIMAISDLIVDVTCGILWGIPTGYNSYSRYVFPRIVPFLIPLSHMAVMVSNFCTGVMGFERFVRFKFLCKFRYRSWISQHNFRYYCFFIIIFPILFFAPKLFELYSEEKTHDCRNITADSRLTKLVYLSLMRPDLMVNATRKQSDIISPSVIERVVSCIEVSLTNETSFTSLHVFTTDLRKNQYYYRIYYIGANTLFGHILPFLLLVIINVLIVRVLNEPPKPDDIVVSTSCNNPVTTPKSTLKVISLPRRGSFFKGRGSSSVVSTTFVQGSSSSPPPPLSPLVFGLDPENISFIDSPTVDAHEANFRNGSVKGGSNAANGKKNKKGSSLKRKCSSRGNSVANQAQPSTVAISVFVGDDREAVSHGAQSSEVNTVASENQQVGHRSPQPSNASLIPPDSPKLRRHGGFRNGFRSRQANAQEARLTRISLSIICLYLICHIWKLIPTVYEAIYGDVNKPVVWPYWLEVIKNMSHVLVVFNSAVNFLLYLIL